MKKSILTLIVAVVAFVFAPEVQAQDFPGLNKSPMDAASYPNNWRNSDKVVRVTYSRPQLKGRSLSKLAPEGKKWRTGANETTEITFYKDVTFGGKSVKAGTYSLYTIPGENEWTVALSNQINVWGAYFHKDENDVVRVTGKVSKSNKNIEAFSIVFGDDMTMYMGWGDVVVSVPIK